MRKAQAQQIGQQYRKSTGSPTGPHDAGRDYVDVREAAEMLGVARRAVRDLAARGRLEAKRDEEGSAARIVVSVASVEKLREERQG